MDRRVTAPRIGQVVYGGPDRSHPQVVVDIVYTTIWTVPLRTNIRSVHQGNLYNETGEREWML